MLALPAPPTLRALDDFKGDPQAMVADFFAVWNKDLPQSLADINNAICQDMMMIHGRTRFASWFKLKSNSVDAVIAKAFNRADGGDGWRETIEELTGFRFDRPSAPESAELVSVPATRSAPFSQQARNVSSRLVQSGMLLRAQLPEACFDVIETVDPTRQTITEEEVQAFTDEVTKYIAAEHGDWHTGAAVARVYGKQARKRLPRLPNRGVTPGENRNLTKMILNKCKNRLYVLLSNRTDQLLPPAPHPLDSRVHVQKSYKSKLSLNAIDLTSNAKELFDAKLSHLVDLDETTKESKYVSDRDEHVVAFAQAHGVAAVYSRDLAAAATEPGTPERAAPERAAPERAAPVPAAPVSAFGEAAPVPATATVWEPAQKPGQKPGGKRKTPAGKENDQSKAGNLSELEVVRKRKYAEHPPPPPACPAPASLLAHTTPSLPPP